MFRHARLSADCKGPCLQNLPDKGCLQPPPVQYQCSFAYRNAIALCNAWEQCAALNCNALRGDCQARDKYYQLRLSFGDAHVYLRHPHHSMRMDDEDKAYRKRFASDYFLHDALHVYRTYFKHQAPGFFVESGALDGSVFGSNSYYFERYLGWSGLLVEASPSNCDRLVRRRNETPRVHTVCTALCASNGLTRFSSPTGGCCGAIGQGGSFVQCTRTQDLFRAYGVHHIDFWSLDVEGGEMNVLRGLDWSIPIRVLLIESVTPSIRRLLRDKGMRKHPFHSPSRLNEIWVNESFG